MIRLVMAVGKWAQFTQIPRDGEAFGLKARNMYSG